MDASAAPKSHGLPEAGYHGQRTRKAAEDNGSRGKVTVEGSTTLVDVTIPCTRLQPGSGRAVDIFVSSPWPEEGDRRVRGPSGIRPRGRWGFFQG